MFCILTSGVPNNHQIPPGDNVEEGRKQYSNLLQKFSEKWLLVQLTHQVSGAAANSFWKLSMETLPKLLEARSNEEVTKHVPGFIHQRRTLYKERCPDIYMTSTYLNTTTGHIEVVKSTTTPMGKYRNSNYTKLYEEAHIKVINLIYVIYCKNTRRNLCMNIFF